jgi:hypothetical protein
MSKLSAGRLGAAVLLAGSLASPGVVAQQDAATTELERAFGAAFDLVPAVAKAAGAACQEHAQQASKIAQLRDLQTSSDGALALLRVPENSSPTEVDQSSAAALTIINRAVVDFVYSRSRPPAEVAAAMVYSACLIEVGKGIGGTRI